MDAWTGTKLMVVCERCDERQIFETQDNLQAAVWADVHEDYHNLESHRDSLCSFDAHFHGDCTQCVRLAGHRGLHQCIHQLHPELSDSERGN